MRLSDGSVTKFVPRVKALDVGLKLLDKIQLSAVSVHSAQVWREVSPEVFLRYAASCRC
jgi:hypothetical protein